MYILAVILVVAVWLLMFCCYNWIHSFLWSPAVVAMFSVFTKYFVGPCTHYHRHHFHHHHTNRKRHSSRPSIYPSTPVIFPGRIFRHVVIPIIIPLAIYSHGSCFSSPNSSQMYFSFDFEFSIHFVILEEAQVLHVHCSFVVIKGNSIAYSMFCNSFVQINQPLNINNKSGGGEITLTQQAYIHSTHTSSSSPDSK